MCASCIVSRDTTIESTRSSATAEIARTCGHYVRRSGSFKIIDFGTNRKPAYHFLLVNLVNNNSLHPISNRFKGIVHSIIQIFAFDRGYLSLTYSFSRTPKITIRIWQEETRNIAPSKKYFEIWNHPRLGLQV